MKNENTEHVVAVKVTTGRQLLELVHIANLDIESPGKLITQPKEKPVLIEDVVGDLFSCIDMYLIIESEEYGIRLNVIPVQGQHQVKQVAEAEIEVESFLKLIIRDFLIKSLFHSNPLLGLQTLGTASPKDLLPQPVFGTHRVESYGGIASCIRIANRKPEVIVGIVGDTRSDNLCRPAVEKISSPGMKIGCAKARPSRYSSSVIHLRSSTRSRYM